MNYPPKIEDSLTALPIGDNFPVTAEMTQAMAEAFTQPECAAARDAHVRSPEIQSAYGSENQP